MNPFLYFIHFEPSIQEYIQVNTDLQNLADIWLYVRLTYTWSDSLSYFKTCRFGDSNWIRDLKYVNKVFYQKGFLIYFWSHLYLLGPLMPYFSWLFLTYKNLFLNQMNLSKKRKQNLQTKNCGGRIDEFYFCACGGNMGVDWFFHRMSKVNKSGFYFHYSNCKCKKTYIYYQRACLMERPSFFIPLDWIFPTSDHQ